VTILEPRLFPVAQHELTSDDYYTPAWVFETMGIRFDLDVCAPPGGIPWIPADHYFDMEADGLAQPWEGRVWMNPPFSGSTPWVDRFIAHGNGVALLPTSRAAWFTRLMDLVDAVVFTRSDFAFVSDLPPRGHVSPGQIFMPTFFAAFGEECVEAIGRVGKVRR